MTEAAIQSTTASQDRVNTRDAGARTDVAFWRSRQPRCAALSAGGGAPSWVKAVEGHLPDTSKARVLEVGVVPGHMLLYFAARRGYACTGIDLSPTIHDVAGAFAAQGVTAEFIQADFLKWECGNRFDLVYSCGLVEHFDDPRLVIERHWRLVRPGGLLVLTVPTLTPFQYAIRRLTYTAERYREMVTTHNPRIMRRGALKRAVSACEGAHVVVARHTREMTVWFGPGSPGVRPWTAPLFGPIREMERVANRLRWSSRWFSPEVVVAARKAEV